MASNVPTVRPVAWISLVPQLIFYGILCYSYHVLLPDVDPVFPGVLTGIAIMILLRNLITKKHRKGVKLFKQQKYMAAVPLFEESFAYFTKNAWLDKYRHFLLFSSSKWTFKEMALCNIAFCYGQVGNGQKAKEYYQRVINEFPNNGLATAGLRMLNAGGQNG
ncbi:MAG TPA: tetratricopeptide repeat protein [Bacteroidia bacterium]|jgi:tetratricopeptide (TPR) repeat protein|nr:tetratricopeptide repeat protein [Bacteroidia bacterium]